jgi:hypothetical protein
MGLSPSNFGNSIFKLLLKDWTKFFLGQWWIGEVYSLWW